MPAQVSMHNYMVKTAARIYVLLARGAPTAVVFRRGPSNQVLLIKWNLTNDSFEVGQWLKRRIYERRCDLSPDGELLVYFAADFRRSIGSWTAVSRPPYFTALALWPKGDCWGGGGLFFSDQRVMINHFSDEINLDPAFSIPSWLSTSSCGEWSGRGEDDPIWSCRLARDGWKLAKYPERTKDDHGAKVWIEYDPPITWEKPHPFWPKKYMLQMSIMGIKERGGPWWLVEHSVLGENGFVSAIGRSDWADWSPNGHLLFAQSGRLYRLRPSKRTFGPIEESAEIADFNDLSFQRSEPPERALSWPPRRGRVRKKQARRK
jgi:hypothetical protein